MGTIIISIVSSIIIGAIASFVVWVIPAEKFEPRIKLACYNQKIVEDYIPSINGKKLKRQMMKRNIHIVNDSQIFAAYNVTCFAELLDGDNNIVYREEKRLPIVKANTTETNAIVLPFERLSVIKLKKEKVVKIELNIVFENRYGTKKTSGPWWIKGYDLEKNTFNPKLEA